MGKKYNGPIKRVIEQLKWGNMNFALNLRTQRDLLDEVHATAGGQDPFVAMLSCIDSRVPVELVFDLGIGDVFSARVAGNVVNSDIVGSLEFAVGADGEKAKVILVLGHTSCGAVKGAIDIKQIPPSDLRKLLKKIQPAIKAETTTPEKKRKSNNPKFVRNVACLNVKEMMGQIRDASEQIRKLEKQGKIAIIGAMYDVANGEVHYLPPVGKTDCQKKKKKG